MSSGANRFAKKEKLVDIKFPEVDKERLEMMMDKLEALKGRKYSTLSYEEQKLVELTCMRSTVTSTGAKWREALQKDKYHTLSYNYWFVWFVGHCYNSQVSVPSAREFHIIEDEPMIVSNLEVTGASYSGSPIYDAILAWPNNNPIRKFKDTDGTKHNINAHYNNKSKSFTYRSKPNFLQNELAYKDAPVWLDEKEVPEVSDTRQFLISLDRVEPDEYGKISFIMEVLERGRLNMLLTKPDWEEFLGTQISKEAHYDAEEYIQNLHNPTIVKTKQEFLESCQANVYTVLEM